MGSNKKVEGKFRRPVGREGNNFLADKAAAEKGVDKAADMEGNGGGGFQEWKESIAVARQQSAGLGSMEKKPVVVH
jgi:hypothetical protein